MTTVPRRSNFAPTLLFGMFALCLYAMLSQPVALERALMPAAGVLPALHLPTTATVLIGLSIGCYGTIIGIGGGPVIMPILITLYGWDNRGLVATCLFIVLLNALSGCIGYASQKRIDYGGGTRFALAAIPGAAITSAAHEIFDVRAFYVIFAFFLMLLGTYLVLSAKNPIAVSAPAATARERDWRRVLIVDSKGSTFDFYSNDSLGIAINLLLGCVIGFLGIGGGVLQVPILLYLLHYPAHIATATSHFVTLVTCGAALIPHALLGNIHYGEAMWMGLGVIVGAQIGVQLARRLRSKTIIDLFTIALFAFAAKLLAS
jgi:uncharacterized membrane protein YfcA